MQAHKEQGRISFPGCLHHLTTDCQSVSQDTLRFQPQTRRWKANAVAICHHDNNSAVGDCKPWPGCLFSSYMALQLNANLNATWHTTIATSNSLCNCLSTLELSPYCNNGETNWETNSVPCYRHHQFPNPCHLVEMGENKQSPLSLVICHVQFSSQHQSKSCYVLIILFIQHIFGLLCSHSLESCP